MASFGSFQEERFANIRKHGNTARDLKAKAKKHPYGTKQHHELMSLSCHHKSEECRLRAEEHKLHGDKQLESSYTEGAQKEAALSVWHEKKSKNPDAAVPFHPLLGNYPKPVQEKKDEPTTPIIE